jgi:hypothetical protein
MKHGSMTSTRSKGGMGEEGFARVKINHISIIQFRWIEYGSF